MKSWFVLLCWCFLSWMILSSTSYAKTVPTRADIGEDCDSNTLCTALNSECINKKCSCKNETVEFDKKCYPKSLLNGNCEIDKQCVIANSHCEDNKITQADIRTCKCDEKYSANDKNTRCLLNVFLGDNCDENTLCVTLNATCNDGICQCDGNYVEDKKKCLKKSKLDEECVINKQCIENSICSDVGNGQKVCKCDEKHVADDLQTKCLSKAELNETCKSNDDCMPENSICESKKCVCNNKTIQVETKCYEKRSYNETCEKTKQCSYEHSVCNEKICACEEKHQYKDGKCGASAIISSIGLVLSMLMILALSKNEY